MNQKSFTLIEVLTVIVVVGVLSGIIIVATNNVVNSTNDAKRKKDLDSIAKGLMVYRNLSGSYPVEASDCNIGDGTCLDELVDGGYAQTFPLDPSGTRYKYTSDGTTYTIKATLSDNQTLAYNPDTGYSQYTGLVGWSKRKSITINSSASLTDYQVKIDVTYDSDMQADFDDLRFTLSNGTTELSHWLESKTDSVSAVFWVKVPSLSIGDNTIYAYYGNGSASSSSNGDNTFEFFDGFEGSSLDTNKWTAYDSSNGISISNSILTISGASSIQRGIYSISTFGTNTINRYYSKYNTYQASGYCNIAGNRYIQILKGTSGLERAVSYVSTEQSTSITIPETVYATYEIKRNNNSNIIFTINDSPLVTHSTQVPTESLNVQYYNYNSATNTYIDWIAIRKYTATEPSISSWGSEESI